LSSSVISPVSAVRVLSLVHINELLVSTVLFVFYPVV
jgi:hypothetical protein